MVVLLQQDAEQLLRLGLAAACGAAVGLNRLHGRRAHRGRLRVHVLVALSACLLTLAAGPQADATSRALQGVAAGVGFLGAGEILLDPHHGKQGRPAVHGLTSAAAIWFTAALGVTVAGSKPFLVITALALALLTLSGHRSKRSNSSDPPPPTPSRA